MQASSDVEPPVPKLVFGSFTRLIEYLEFGHTVRSDQQFEAMQLAYIAALRFIWCDWPAIVKSHSGLPNMIGHSAS